MPATATLADHVVMLTFLGSAIKCLLCSTAYHTLLAHANPDVFEHAVTMDYCSISFLMFGSFMSFTYYGLYRYPHLQAFYIALLAVIYLTGVVIPWFAFFRSAPFRYIRAGYFVFLGMCSTLICIHIVYLNGFLHMEAMAPIELIVLELGLYLLGVLLYLFRVPEKWFPGRLDYALNSHQLWHVLVVSAAHCHYTFVTTLMRMRLGPGGI